MNERFKKVIKNRSERGLKYRNSDLLLFFAAQPLALAWK